jgi:F-type H+-transporting ATPase subunit alpha
MSIYAATNNWLKDYPLSVVKRYEEELLTYVEANHKDILDEIRTEKKISDALKERMNNALEKFKSTFDPNKKVSL